MKGFLISILVFVALSVSGQNTAELIASGKQQYDAKDYLTALSTLDEVIAKTDTIAAAFKLRGDIKQRIDNFEGAIEDYNKAKDIDNDDPRLFVSRSAARISLGNMNGAIRDLERAIKMDPEDADAHFNLACTKYINEDNKGALRDLHRTLELQPEHANALFLRGVVRGEEFEEEEGLADIEKALSMNPDIPGGDMAAGILLYEMDKFSEAAERFTKVLAMNDDDTRIDAFYYRGDCYYNLEEKEKACADFRRAARFGDNDANFVVAQYCETDAKRIKKIPKRHKRETSIQF